ncbi:MAG: hypothetical protein EOM73_16070 [Bacteroidia bacterium]|nr:hypothetical protein [Bacteroidia bacterium]
MKINNKLDSVMTGPMKLGGYIFLFSAVFAIYQGALLLGISVAVVILFFIFSFSGVEIDTVTRRIKQYNQFFGLFKVGKWESLDTYAGVTLVPMRKVSTIASRANLTTSTVQKDYRIYLVNKAKKPAVAIKICKSKELGQNSLDEFSVWLKMPVFSVKR